MKKFLTKLKESSSNKMQYAIKIKYSDGTDTYVYDKYSKIDGRTLITPHFSSAQKFISYKAAESWFDMIKTKGLRNISNYTLEVESRPENQTSSYTIISNKTGDKLKTGFSTAEEAQKYIHNVLYKDPEFIKTHKFAHVVEDETSVQESLEVKSNEQNELEFLGVILEFKEGSNDTSYKSMKNKLVSLDRMNSYLVSEDEKVQKRKQNDGYIGYDKAYVDVIFKLDEKAYRAHLIRVDLGDGIRTIELSDIEKIKNYVNNFINGSKEYSKYIYEVNSVTFDKIREFKSESKMINKKEIKERYNEYSDDPNFDDNVKKVNKRDYWETVAKELGKELSMLEVDEYSRYIQIGDIEIVHNWRYDGSPLKPVTHVNDKRLGRFAIWTDPTWYADDIKNAISDNEDEEYMDYYTDYVDKNKDLMDENVDQDSKRGPYIKRRKRDVSKHIYDELENLGYIVFANTKGGYYVSKKQEQNLDKAKNFLDQNDIEYKPSKFRDRFYLDIVVPGFAMGENLELKIEENKSEQLFYGVPRVKFVYHGDWSDPEVEYKGKIYSYYDLEESLWLAFREECEEKNIESNGKEFEKWVLKNKDYVYSDLEDMSPIEESKNKKGNNKILENSDDVGFRYIETGLTGKINSDILNSVIGQMSDGMWENSPSMEKYWRFVDIEEDNGELLIVVSAESGKYDDYSKRGYTENKFYSMSADEVKKFFASKIKRIAYEETSGEQWSRDNNKRLDYLSYKEDVQVKDAYKAYETLLGRKTDGKYDDRRTPLKDEIKQWVDEKIKSTGWIFQSELNRDNSKEQEEVNKIINGYGYSTFDSNDLLQYVRPSQKSQLLDIIGDNGKIVSKVSKSQVVKDLQSSQIDSQPAIEPETKDDNIEDENKTEAVRSSFTLISEFYNMHIENASKEEILEHIEKKMIYVSHDRKYKLSEDLDRMKKSNDTIKFSDFRIILQ